MSTQYQMKLKLKSKLQVRQGGDRVLGALTQKGPAHVRIVHHQATPPRSSWCSLERHELANRRSHVAKHQYGHGQVSQLAFSQPVQDPAGTASRRAGEPAAHGDPLRMQAKRGAAAQPKAHQVVGETRLSHFQPRGMAV